MALLLTIILYLTVVLGCGGLVAGANRAGVPVYTCI